MPIDQTRSKRKASGGRLRDHRKSRQYARGREPIMTRIDAVKTFVVQTLGGHRKHKLRSANVINVTNPKDNKTQKTTVESVLKNPANRNFERRNILTKGCVVQTPMGKVVITSRPGQTNALSGVLVE